MTWAAVIETDLKESAAFATTYLRDALADDEPGTAVVALQHVARARGGIDGLELTSAEVLLIANVLSRHLVSEPLRQAA